jgi:hypothetical protein
VVGRVAYFAAVIIVYAGDLRVVYQRAGSVVLVAKFVEWSICVRRWLLKGLKRFEILLRIVKLR